MTKREIIEEIQYAEACLYCDLKADELKRRPKQERDITRWISADGEHREKYGAWLAISKLIERLDIEIDNDLQPNIYAAAIERKLQKQLKIAE